nr:neuropeptide [Hymenolepis microstoma]
MAFSKIFVLTFLLAAFVSTDAFKLKSREDGMRVVPSEMIPSLYRRYPPLADAELDLPSLIELYEMEKRRTPYSGGIFGR